MKKFNPLAIAVFLLLILGLIVGTLSSEFITSERVSGIPSEGQIRDSDTDDLKIIIFGDQLELDPVRIEEDDYVSSLVARHIYDRLVEVNAAGEVTSSIAIDWEANDDRSVWDFYIDQDAKLHDGTPITAELIRDLFGKDLNSDNARGQALDRVQRIEVVDDYQLRFLLRDADPQFPKTTMARMSMSVGSVDEDETITGSGAYCFLRQSKESIVLSSFEDATFDTLKIRLLRDDINAKYSADWSEHQKKLLAEADVVALGDPHEVKRLALELELTVEMLHAPNVRGLLLNDSDIFDNTRIRQAVLHALGTSEELLQQGGELLTYLHPASTWLPAGHKHATNTHARLGFPKNEDEFERLLTDAGMNQRDDGTWMRTTDAGLEIPFSLTVIAPSETYFAAENVIRMVEEYLENSGIEVNLHLQEWGKFSGRLFVGDFDIALVGWAKPTPTSYDFLRPWFHPDGSLSLNRQDKMQLGEIFEPARYSAVDILDRAHSDRLLPLYCTPAAFAVHPRVKMQIEDSWLPLFIPR